MPDNILSAFKAEELLAIQNSSVAIANPEQKIVWYNQSFKNDLGAGRIKGNSISNLFSLPDSLIPVEIKSEKPIIHTLNDSSQNVIITPIFSKKKKA